MKILKRLFENHLLMSCIIAMGIAIIVLIGAYDSLPEEIPMTRSLTGAWSTMIPTSLLAAARFPLMGVGQIGAAAVMVHAARRSDAVYWLSFWKTILLVATAKSVLETIQLALFGLDLPVADQLFFAATLGVIAVGLTIAILRIRRNWNVKAEVSLSNYSYLLLGLFLSIWLSSSILIPAL